MKKMNLWLMVLAGVIFLGIGYASISNITLSINGSATAKGNATNEDFKVRFVKFDSSDNEYVNDASSNAAVVKTTNGIDTSNVTLDVTGDTTATFGISEGFDEVGDYVTLEYNIVNESVGIPAYIYIDVENESNTASDYFRITKTIADNELEEGEVTKVTVKVELIARPKLDTDASFTVKLTASDTKEETEPAAPTYAVFTPGDEIKYDPVENAKCTSGDTCYIWNVIKVGDTTSDSTITMQLDHNIINMSKWANLNTTKGPTQAFSVLEEATAQWNDALKLNYTYDTTVATNNYGELTCTDGTCVVGEETITTNLKARMITGEEVRELTMYAGAADNSLAGKWSLSTDGNEGVYYFSKSDKTIGTYSNLSGQVGSTQLSWLVQNTNAYETSGATTNVYGDKNYGYWTMSPVSTHQFHVWYVRNIGTLGIYDVSTSNLYGIRPVITVSKSIF